VEAQRHHLWITNGFGFNPLFLPMAVMFLISSMAETARAPFDLTEAESELVAGYQTEYSSMSFALFWLGEYANVILMCTLNALLFWGGYLPPIDWAPLYVVPGILWLFLKILVFFFIFSWVKATVPRYRYDQLMRLGWKIFLPISILWVVLVSGYLMLTRYGSDENGYAASSTVKPNWNCDVRNATGNLVEVRFTGEQPKFGLSSTRWSVVAPSSWAAPNVALNADISLGGDGISAWSTASGKRLTATFSWSHKRRLDGVAMTLVLIDHANNDKYVGSCRSVDVSNNGVKA
jgi:hypothetical protein